MSLLPHNANDLYFFLLGVCLTGIFASVITTAIILHLRPHLNRPIELPGYARPAVGRGCLKPVRGLGQRRA